MIDKINEKIASISIGVKWPNYRVAIARLFAILHIISENQLENIASLIV
jgi:hypothetical protein